MVVGAQVTNKESADVRVSVKIDFQFFLSMFISN